MSVALLLFRQHPRCLGAAARRSPTAGPPSGCRSRPRPAPTPARSGRRPAIWSADRALGGQAVEAHAPVLERFDAARTTVARRRAPAACPSAPSGSWTSPDVEHVEHAPVGERDVHLDVVGVPLVGDRFDGDARKPDVVAVVPDPDVHRLAHLGIVGLGREDELASFVESRGQIDTHGAPFVRSAHDARRHVAVSRRTDRHACGTPTMRPPIPPAAVCVERLGS